MNLGGKTALVTGGAVRIGREIALALAGHGVKVALHFHTSRDAAEETLAHIRNLGVEAEAFPADLRRTDDLGRLVHGAVERFGRLDYLINSASVFRPGGLMETTQELWQEHFAVNLTAPFFLCQAFARAGSSGHGHIINIADWRGIRPRSDYVAYTLTKSGIIAMTQALALALAPGVQVNAVAPGAILPPPGRDESYLEQLAGHVPLRRTGSPRDVCDAILYLLKAGYVTGQTLFVDGGEHL